MKNFYSKLLLSCGIFGLCIANVSASEYKIGVVNQQVAIENSICGKSYQESMQKELDARQVKLSERKNMKIYNETKIFYLKKI